ncbi:RipA family octameric membrane protein [Dactylosporangium sp. CA-139114]|uniref:RipA family octameric membrane protein n=1 Tax=Dactylosporangium sp. CA-139114 TaxID=3239931 RepID=UPI003D99D438
MSAIDRFLGGFRRTSAAIDEIREDLWTAVDSDAYAGAGEKYQAAVLEQYRIYVEMADRLSARRGLTNTFLLTVNTATLTAAGTLVPQLWSRGAGLLVIPCIVLVGQCVAWFWLIRSYRQLSSAKFRVIGALEERLPASPYWRAEWNALGAGRDKRRYWSVTSLEQWVPVLFALLYAALFVIVAVR